MFLAVQNYADFQAVANRVQVASVGQGGTGLGIFYYTESGTNFMYAVSIMTDQIVFWNPSSMPSSFSTDYPDAVELAGALSYVS